MRPVRSGSILSKKHLLLLDWRPEVALGEGATILMLLLCRVGLLRVSYRRWRHLLHLLHLLLRRWRLVQDGGGGSEDICIVNDLALFILVPPHVVAQDVVVPEDAEADGALGVLLLKLSDLLGRDIAVGLDQMLVE